MERLSLDRSNLAQTAAVTLVSVAALALLALVLARWSWEWLGPRPQPSAQLEAVAPDHAASAGGLFGSPAAEKATSVPTAIAIKLLGIAAATGGRSGYAVVRLEPREILTVREGEDIAPGIRLAEIATDHVILERGGTRETLAWPQKPGIAESAIPSIGN